MIISLTLLNRSNAFAFMVEGEANTNVSSCLDKFVHEKVTEKMATKLFYLSVFIFILCLYVYLSSQKVRN